MTGYVNIRYHPAGEPVTFTLSECEEAVSEARKEFPRGFPQKTETWIWYLQHSEYQIYKAINRARDLLFLRRKV